jgi:alpha-L-fucosidase 2
LLPALPTQWPAGSVKGLRARGGITLDIEWKNHQLTKAIIHTKFAKKIRIRTSQAAEGLTLVDAKRGKTLALISNKNIGDFNAKSEGTYLLLSSER